MNRDNNELDKLSDKDKNKDKIGENDMSVIEKELEEMQKLQQKRKLTREELKKAMIKQTIRENYEALERLSRT